MQIFILILAGAIIPFGTPNQHAKSTDSEGPDSLAMNSKAQELAQINELKTMIDDGRIEEAVSRSRSLMKEQSDLPQAHYLFSVARRMEMGQNPFSWMMGKNEYIKELRRAIELDPGFVDPYMELIGFYTGAPAIAGGSMEKALEVARSMAPYFPLRSIVKQAEINLRKENYEEAENILHRGLQTHPENLDMLYQLGMVSFLQGNYGKARQIFDQGKAIFDKQDQVDAGSKGLEILYQAGKIRVVSKTDLDEAVTLFEQYIAKVGPGQSPTQADALWRMAQALRYLEKPEKAKMALQKALELNPEHVQAQKELESLTKVG